MDTVTHQVTRAWSAVVARGGAGDPHEVADELARRGTMLSAADVHARLKTLRADGALPDCG